MTIYRGIGPEKGRVVPEEHAFEYALAEINKDSDLQTELVEWFFSGNWIKEHEMKARKRHEYEVMEGLRDEPI